MTSSVYSGIHNRGLVSAPCIPQTRHGTMSDLSKHAMTKIQITALFGALAVVWIANRIFHGEPVSFAMFFSLVGLAGLATTFVQVFDKFLWRWKYLTRGLSHSR